MRKRLLLSGLLLCAAGSVRAQAPINLPSETFKQKIRSQYLQNDTVQAIVTLYGRRQAGGASWIVTSALTAVRMATAGGRQTNVGGGYVIQEEAPSFGLALLLSAPFAAYGVGKLAHYSNRNLERIVTAYGAGQPLPRSLRRKLKPRFFAEPIIPYQPVSSQPVKP